MDKFNIEKIIKIKLSQFKEKKINIESEDIKKYLDNVYFKKQNINLESLKLFVSSNNINDIIDFLMSDAIINPKF
ncbi:MAG: hypothetical protein HRS50_00870 [Mycoplasmataceae bacterium]|nr:hypothetical protein [Mycoplasmataceae bacterium]